MEEAAFGQRVHPLKRLRLLQGRKAIRGGQKKLIRTHGVLLERRHGIRAGIEPLGLQVCARRLGDAHETVELRPSLLCACPPLGDRSLETVVRCEHVSRTAPDLVIAQHQPAKHREVVLEVVDGIRSILRRRPRKARARLLRCHPLECLVIGNAAGDRAQDLERVERRHTRTSFGRFDARVRNVEALGSSPDGEAKEQAFDIGSIGLNCQSGREIQRSSSSSSGSSRSF